MILVTGGTGLVGSHLLYELVQKGEPVSCIIRETSSTSLIKKIFNLYADNASVLFSKINWIVGDLRDPFSLQELLVGIDQVYHCAGMVSFDNSREKEIIEINIQGTANLINACLDNKVKKLCHVSSIAALGNITENNIITEENEWNPGEPHSVYAISKYKAELEIYRGIEEGLPAIIVQPSVILGPGNWEKGSPAIFNTIYKGLKYYPPGSSGFVDVRDLATCMIKLMNSHVKNDNFIISAENYSFKNIFSLIAKEFDKKVPTKEITPFMANIGWRMEKIYSKLTGSPPRITRDSIRAGFNQLAFSNEKILNTIDFKFYPIEQSVKDICGFFMVMNKPSIPK